MADPPTQRRQADSLCLAAEQGEPRGLYHAAQLHLSGDGLPKDLDKAETYLRKSAKRDYLPAIMTLAEFYSRGSGVEPDLHEAAVWFRRAAELGDVKAQFTMGRLHATGTGVAQNLRQAANWFLRAAEQGHATAAHNVAVFYAQGSGVEKDPETGDQVVPAPPQKRALLRLKLRSDDFMLPATACRAIGDWRLSG